MPNRTIIAFTCLLTMLPFVVKAGYGPDITQESSAAQQISGGCATCHPKLSETMPEGHFKVKLEEMKYCLICHSLKGTAPAFDWTMHRDHFSKPDFKGDCWSCHLIDQEGDFRIIGVTGGQDIKITKDKVDKELPYFVLWASSEYLGHTHAKRGVTCSLCHGALFPEKPPDMAQCLTCHGSYEHLAELTIDEYPNPHESHEGEIECTLCHKAHAESEFECEICHEDFDLKVP